MDQIVSVYSKLKVHIPCKVTSGVLQGSVLGPTLLLMTWSHTFRELLDYLQMHSCLIYCPICTPADRQIFQNSKSINVVAIM